MSKVVKLQASDGHELDAYVAEPEGKPRAGLVVVQEIFGVNQHIRSVADRFAQEGFYAVAPALFDRVQRNVELGLRRRRAAKKGMAIAQKIEIDNAVEGCRSGLAICRQRDGETSWGGGLSAMAERWPG